MKAWYWSKLNWLGLLQVLVGVADQLSQSDALSLDWKNVALAASGIFTVVIRTWFTWQPVGKDG